MDEEKQGWLSAIERCKRGEVAVGISWCGWGLGQKDAREGTVGEERGGKGEHQTQGIGRLMVVEKGRRPI
eukprot:1662317-Rhodomonas_salina.2